MPSTTVAAPRSVSHQQYLSTPSPSSSASVSTIHNDGVASTAKENDRNDNTITTTVLRKPSNTHPPTTSKPLPPAYTFILPDLYRLDDGFRQFLERDMIEMPTLRRLEASGHLNWWCVHPSQKLYPLVTTGDGNCLLHAASLATWGVHDRLLHLRNLLYHVLQHGSRKHAFWRRWRWSETVSNRASGLVLSEEEWTKEWNDVLQMATPLPRPSTQTPTPSTSAGGGCATKGVSAAESYEQIYESLETIHVFALANILKRPIIIVSDTVLRNANGEELAPIPFGGIYLPLECPPEQCHRSPLVLCYDSSHFSALVAMRIPNSPYLTAIPITDKNRNILPVHFAIDPSPDFSWWTDDEDKRIAERCENLLTEDYRLRLIAKYMDIVKMDLRRGSIKKTSPVMNDTEPQNIPTGFLTLAGRDVSSASGNGTTTTFSDPDTANNNNNNNMNGTSTAQNGKTIGTPRRIMKEIQHQIKRIGRRSKKHSLPSVKHFSAAELRQSNCMLTVLLHNYAHQYTDSMVDNYINTARKRFEELRTLPAASCTPKNRLSRSFSSSSVLLLCLNSHCGRKASPSTNFLCPQCFEAQKREMATIGSPLTSNTPVSTSNDNSTWSIPSSSESMPRGLYACYRDGPNPPIPPPRCNKSKTMPEISLIDGDSTEESETDNDVFRRHTPQPPPAPVMAKRTAPVTVARTNIHVTPGTALCHANGISSNISATNITYQCATTRS